MPLPFYVFISFVLFLETVQSCKQSIYVLPIYDSLTVDNEFDLVYKYFELCQQKNAERNKNNELVVLSLETGNEWLRCQTGDDCKQKINETRTDFKTMMINGANKTYDLYSLFKNKLNDGCLEKSVLLMPINLRCSRIEDYPVIWNFIGQLRNNALNYLDSKKLHTYMIWLNYNHLSPTDTVGCELGHLLKPRNSRFHVLPTDKNSVYLTETLPLTYCKVMPTSAPVNTLLIVLIVVSVVVIILLCTILVVCVVRNRKRHSTPRDINEWVRQQESSNAD
ncbi:hypothetical protein M3Y94_01252200 [Aphelenchoides besseyi]|nr:hypothetical protein M3Y94_01252200 [Aphelenchoides besseyi]KAI6219422.1 hypothetical protein M3Y95_01109500 [Aphelenchoides besseyi]